MSNHLRETVYLIRKSPFHFYQMFSAGLSAFLFLKNVNFDLQTTLAAATLFFDKTYFF